MAPRVTERPSLEPEYLLNAARCGPKTKQRGIRPGKQESKWSRQGPKQSDWIDLGPGPRFSMLCSKSLPSGPGPPQ